MVGGRMEAEFAARRRFLFMGTPVSSSMLVFDRLRGRGKPLLGADPACDGGGGSLCRGKDVGFRGCWRVVSATAVARDVPQPMSLGPLQ